MIGALLVLGTIEDGLNEYAQHITMGMTKNKMLDQQKVVDAIVSGKLSSFDTKTRICEVINGSA